MRTTSSTRSASPLMSGRQEGTSATTSSPAPATAKPSASRISTCSFAEISTPASVFTRSSRKVTENRRMRRLAGDHQLRGLAAAKLQDHVGRDLGARLDEGRIDAALEAEARVGDDAELAARRRRADRIEISGLEEDVLRLRAAAGRLAADDAGNPFRTGIVGDHRHLAVERVGLAVERLNGLAVAREPRVDRALHLVRVEDVERTAVAHGDVVGDVDERRDRAKPDGAKPPLHPGGRRPVLHAAEIAPDEERAGLVVRVVEAELDGDRALEAADDRRQARAASAGRSPSPRGRGRCRRRRARPAGSA